MSSDVYSSRLILHHQSAIDALRERRNYIFNATRRLSRSQQGTLDELGMGRLSH